MNRIGCRRSLRDRSRGGPIFGPLRFPVTEAKKFRYAAFRSASACCSTTADTSPSQARSGVFLAAVEPRRQFGVGDVRPPGLVRLLPGTQPVVEHHPCAAERPRQRPDAGPATGRGGSCTGAARHPAYLVSSSNTATYALAGIVSLPCTPIWVWSPNRHPGFTARTWNRWSRSCAMCAQIPGRNSPSSAAGRGRAPAGEPPAHGGNLPACRQPQRRGVPQAAAGVPRPAPPLPAGQTPMAWDALRRVRRRSPSPSFTTGLSSRNAPPDRLTSTRLRHQPEDWRTGGHIGSRAGQG